MEMILKKPLPPILCEDHAFPGVCRVCGMLADDFFRVFGQKPECLTSPPECGEMIFAGTIGRSPLLELLENQGKLDLSGVRG